MWKGYIKFSQILTIEIRKWTIPHNTEYQKVFTSLTIVPKILCLQPFAQQNTFLIWQITSWRLVLLDCSIKILFQIKILMVF